jgi:hypothetical protein
MKKLIIVFLLISTYVFASPKVNIYTDLEFQHESKEITNIFLSYPINKKTDMLDVYVFFYNKSNVIDKWIVHDKDKNMMVLSFTFSKINNNEITNSVSLTISYPYNDKYKDKKNIIKKSEFYGNFSFGNKNVIYKNNELKKQLLKLISKTDEDINIEEMP